MSDTPGIESTRAVDHESQHDVSSAPHATLDALKVDGVRMSEQVNALNDTIDLLIKDIQETGSKKFKCKEYPLDNNFVTRTKTIVRGIKDVFKDLEIYTDRHLEYLQDHHRTKFFDKTQVLLMQMATSADETKYQVLIYSVINMVERLVSLLNLFFDCSAEWAENDHMKDEMKQNIYLFLDLIEHQASYIVTLDLFFKKYSSDGSMKKVGDWLSKAGMDARKEKMKKLHKKFAPDDKQSGVGCVIS